VVHPQGVVGYSGRQAVSLLQGSRTASRSVQRACYDKSTDESATGSQHGRVASRRRQETVATALGRRIKGLRTAKGWSQERLAEEAALDRSYVAGIELGDRNPSLKALDRLAKALRVRLSELLGDLRFVTRCVTRESRCTVSNSAPIRLPLARPCSVPCPRRPSRHRKPPPTPAEPSRPRARNEPKQHQDGVFDS
jgi:transcriptional regulator with XRE-family HTH domain